MGKVALLWSGGIDCLASYVMYKGKVDVLVCVDMRHKYARLERVAAWVVALELGIAEKIEDVSFPLLGEFEKPNAEIPMRNVFLLMIAKLFASEVVISIELGSFENESDDRSMAFLSKMGGMLVGMDPHTVISNPVKTMTKVDEVRVILDYFGETRAIELLKKTYSCYSGKGRCGKCKACIRTYLALRYWEIDCDGWFASNPSKSSTYEKYRVAVQAGKYPGKRGGQYQKVFLGDGGII